MRHALLVVVLASGCYGGVQFDWEARAVIGVRAQAIPIAQLGDVAATATWLSIRTDAADITYPLRIDGPYLVVDSAFDDVGLATVYDPYGPELASRPRPGSFAVPLDAPYPRPSPDQAPGEQPFHAAFELSILGGPEPVRIPVRLAPTFDPCRHGGWSAADAKSVPPIAPNASPLSPTAPPFVQDATSVTIPPFTIRIIIQEACSESIG